MKNILIFSVFFLLLTLDIKAQEPAVFTHYHLQPILINPAASGFNQDGQVIFSHRNKWAAFPGAPKSFHLSIDGRVRDRVGLGLQLMSDNVASIRRFQGQLNYAYQFQVNDFDVGLGISTGIQQLSLDSDVTSSSFYNEGDPLIIEAVDGVFLFDAGAAVYADNGTVYAGLMIPNAVRNRLKDIPTAEEENNNIGFGLNVGYRHVVSNYNFIVEPSILLQNIRRVDFRTDLNVLLRFLDDQLIGGVSYSLGAGSRFGFLLGTRVNHVRIYYSYDVSFQDFQQYNNGSHEISIGVNLSKDKSAVINEDM